jgi:hypothetical protein
MTWFNDLGRMPWKLDHPPPNGVHALTKFATPEKMCRIRRPFSVYTDRGPSRFKTRTRETRR